MTFKLNGSFEVYRDPSGNPLISLNRDGSINLVQIDFADGTTQNTAAGGSSGAVVLAPTGDQTITGAHALILSDAASTFYVGTSDPFGAFGDSGQMFIGSPESSQPAILQGYNGGPTRLEVSSVNDANGALTILASGTQDTIGLTIGVEAQNGASFVAGMDGNIGFNGAGTLTSLFGYNFSLGNDSSGTITNATNLVASNPSNDNGGTITNAIGLLVANQNTSPGITNSWGIKIQDQTNSGSAPNAKAIEVLGGSVNLGPQPTTVGTLIESTTHTPSSAGDTGITGQFAWDASFVYVCTATNTWKRSAIASW